MKIPLNKIAHMAPCKESWDAIGRMADEDGAIDAADLLDVVGLAPMVAVAAKSQDPEVIALSKRCAAAMIDHAVGEAAEDPALIEFWGRFRLLFLAGVPTREAAVELSRMERGMSASDKLISHMLTAALRFEWPDALTKVFAYAKKVTHPEHGLVAGGGTTGLLSALASGGDAIPGLDTAALRGLSAPEMMAQLQNRADPLSTEEEHLANAVQAVLIQET